MPEFGSQTGTPRVQVFAYAGAIFLVAAGVLFLFARYQKDKLGPNPAVSAVEGMLRPGDPNFEYYRNYVRITDVKASLGINIIKNRIAIISGFITNEGDRKLDAVELHISLYDVYGNLSKERTATPLRPGIGLNRPMDPLERRDFTVWIEPIEQLWNPKRMEIELTGLRYR